MKALLAILAAALLAGCFGASAFDPSARGSTVTTSDFTLEALDFAGVMWIAFEVTLPPGTFATVSTDLRMPQLDSTRFASGFCYVADLAGTNQALLANGDHVVSGTQGELAAPGLGSSSLRENDASFSSGGQSLSVPIFVALSDGVALEAAGGEFVLKVTADRPVAIGPLVRGGGVCAVGPGGFDGLYLRTPAGTLAQGLVSSATIREKAIGVAYLSADGSHKARVLENDQVVAQGKSNAPESVGWLAELGGRAGEWQFIIDEYGSVGERGFGWMLLDVPESVHLMLFAVDAEGALWPGPEQVRIPAVPVVVG